MQMPFMQGMPQQGQRGGFPGMPQQGGRGAPQGMPQMPQMPYGMPPQMGGFNPAFGNAAAYAQLMQAAQAQAAAMGGRGAGRGGPMQGMPMQGMPGMQGMPPQMMGGPQGGRGGFSGMPPRGGGMMGGPGRGGPEEQRGRAPNRGPGPQMGGNPGLDVSQLQQAPPAQQKQMLGEALYPKIHAQQPERAGKITGMLLEMENQELLGLTTDDDALRAKVDEAMNVYDEYLKNQPGSGNDAGPQPNGTENMNPTAEEVKDPEA
ncbi:Protein phosphatase PP2A regulatory subunit B [Teratosphaeriaceae sp. CCFEE 6253]|nr:Protein phosphatase PP2A regulatory subunit B [Teratosphaeriaceae sp. CCFEE 6253]